jgi:hypothetical protein
MKYLSQNLPIHIHISCTYMCLFNYTISLMIPVPKVKSKFDAFIYTREHPFS